MTATVEADVIPTNPGSPGELLRLLRDGRPRTRAEFVVETGLARSTVRARLDALLDAGLITDGGNGVSTGGRPAGRFVFNAMARVALAAEVGATHATIAVADLTGALLATDKLELDIAEGPDVVLPLLIAAWRALLAKSGLAHTPLAGVGIGLPGP
ncbi:MAG TPA: hypothetical protein VM677_13115, partial [Actinokineospora sp.]|nr:hypothetical protein [Actinokineospora sp.]